VPWSEASVLLGLLHIELVAGGDSEDVGEVGKIERRCSWEGAEADSGSSIGPVFSLKGWRQRGPRVIGVDFFRGSSSSGTGATPVGG
jgi:hypothetical protein